MSEPFDPHYIWFAIPPEEQPPNHYRLLGLRLFEDKPEVIEHAADQRMAHLRSIQTGKHVRQSQELLNEVATARVCLLNEARKAAYDAELREKTRAEAAAAEKEQQRGEVSAQLGHFLDLVEADQRSAHQSGIGKRKSPGRSGILGHKTARPKHEPQEAAAPPATEEEEAPQNRRMKLVISIGSAVMGILLILIAAVLIVRSGGKDEPKVETAMVFDWSKQEREEAILFVDKKPFSFPESGPLVLPCKPGKYRIQTDRKGFKPYEEVVHVKAGEQKEIRPTWQSQAYLAIDWPAGERRGAELLIDDKPQEIAALVTWANPNELLVPLDTGSHKVRVARRGYETFEQTVTVVETETRRIRPKWKQVPDTAKPDEGLSLAEMLAKSRPDLMGKSAPPEPAEVVPDPADPAETTPKVVPDPPKTALELLPELSETRQREIVKELDDVYHLSEAKGPSEKVALARKLHAARGKYNGNPEEQLVLLRKAMELAREGGDAALMLQVADAIGAGFDVEAPDIKAKALADFAATATDQARIKSLVESSGAVIDQNLAEARYRAALDLADRVYAACTKSQGRPFRKRAYDRRTRVQEVYKAWEQFQAALNTLQNNPDDPAANATVGRWYTINRGDWDRGLPYLAKGGDGRLRLAAEADLTSPPEDPNEQVKRGDTWWDLGQSGTGKERDALLLRAGHWYRQAQPGVASALARDKLTQRLEAIAKIGPPTALPGGVKPGPGPVDVTVQPPAKLPKPAEPPKPADGSLPGRLALLTGPASIPGVRWWTIETPAHRGEVRALAFDPKGDVLATAGRDGVIRLWHIAGGKLTKALIGHEEEITWLQPPDRVRLRSLGW